MAISGGGTIENTNPLILNDPSSILSLANVNISKITVTGEQSDGMISVDNDSSIETLSLNASSRFNLSDNKTLTVQNSFEVPQNKSMEMIGTESGKLFVGDELSLSGILKLSSPDTFSNGKILLNGGTLTVNEDSYIESDISHLDDSSINITPGKSLNYSGIAIETGSLTITSLLYTSDTADE